MKMTKIFATALPLCAAALLAGCNDAAVEENIAPEAPRCTIFATIENDADDTRAYVDDQSFLVNWEKGDKISFFPAGANDRYEAILAEGCEDHSYGLFDCNLTITENPDARHYGVFPHSADNSLEETSQTINTVLPAEQSYHAGMQRSFGGLNTYMTAYAPATANYSLTFQSYHSAIGLRLKGDAEVAKIRITSAAENLAGKVTIATPYTAAFPVAEAAEGSKSVTFDCGSVQLTAEAQPFCVALLPGTYTKLTVEILDAAGNALVAKTASNIAFNRAKIKMMPEFEVKKAETVNLTENGAYANCYIVTKAGDYKFATKHVDGTTISGNYSVVDWVWRTTGVELTNIKYESGYIYFTVKDFVEGNASIGAFDTTSRNFLHNWHIWLTDQPQSVTCSGYEFLDRNLGATTTEASSLDNYGLLYQWGRKDPMRNYAAGSINDKPAVNPIWNQLINLSQYWTDWSFNFKKWCTFSTINNYPLCFMSGYSNGYYTDLNWFNYTSLSASVYNYMWSGSKTNYDPCPVGYQVPTSDEFASLDYTVDDISGNIGFTITADTEYSVLPAQGYIRYDGVTKYIGQEATVWTSTCRQYYQTDGYQQYLLLDSQCFSYILNSGSLNLDDVNRSFACPVRCIKK